MIEHYFPGKDVSKMDFDEFAIWSCNAEWMHEQVVTSQQMLIANTIGAMFGGGGKG